MTKFFRAFWGILLLLSIGWICLGVMATSQSVVETDAEFADAETEDASDLGIGIGASLSLSVVLCTGLPFFILFGLLYWRNGVKLQEDKRHQEQLDAMRAMQQGAFPKEKR